MDAAGAKLVLEAAGRGRHPRTTERQAAADRRAGGEPAPDAGPGRSGDQGKPADGCGAALPYGASGRAQLGWRAVQRRPAAGRHGIPPQRHHAHALLSCAVARCAGCTRGAGQDLRVGNQAAEAAVVVCEGTKGTMRMRCLVAGLLLALTAAPAFAQSKPASQMSQADARAYFEQYMSRGPVIDGCGDKYFTKKGEGVVFTETGLTITCKGGKSRSVQFADSPSSWIRREMMYGKRFNVCVGDGRGQKECGAKDILIFYDMDDPQRFVD